MLLIFWVSHDSEFWISDEQDQRAHDYDKVITRYIMPQLIDVVFAGLFALLILWAATPI
jgi:hypothetical protein